MTVSHPEDKVDFLGRYLLSYVQRKKKSQMTEDELRDILSQEESYNREAEETKESERQRIAIITNQATEAITIEQEKFITMNATVTSRLSEAILKIPELEEAALTYVPPPPVVEGVEGEGGEMVEGEAPPAEIPPVVEEVPVVVTEGEPVPEEPQFDENGNEIIKPPPPIPGNMHFLETDIHTLSLAHSDENTLLQTLSSCDIPRNKPKPSHHTSPLITPHPLITPYPLITRHLLITPHSLIS